MLPHADCGLQASAGPSRGLLDERRRRRGDGRAAHPFCNVTGQSTKPTVKRKHAEGVPHSTRAVLTSLRKRGVMVARRKTPNKRASAYVFETDGVGANGQG